MAIVYTNKAQHILVEDDSSRTLCGLRFHGQWSEELAHAARFTLPACKPCAAVRIMHDLQRDEWENGETF